MVLCVVWMDQHEILVLIASLSNEGSGESAHMRGMPEYSLLEYTRYGCYKT